MRGKFTKEQLEICEAVKELCNQRLNENIWEEDEKEIFNYQKWRAISDMGILSMPFEERLGGLGQSLITTALVVKTLAQYCKDEGIVFSVCAQLSAIQIPIWRYGTEEQKEKYLIPLMNGTKIGSSVISEPQAGSDVSSMQMQITSDSDCYYLNGTKTFATLAPVSDVLLVYGKHPNGIPMLDISAFLLEKGEYRIGQEYEKTGLRTSPMSEVILQNVSIPKNRLVGRANWGMNIFMDAMIWEKILVSAYHVGAMEQQYQDIYQYAMHRKQFQTRIIEFESVHNKIIDMRMRLETSRLMLYDVCQRYDEGKLKKYHAAMLKMHTSEAKLKNSIDAVNIMGAYGIIKESMAEKQMRDSMAAQIYSGTNEMQKRIMYEEMSDYIE